MPIVKPTIENPDELLAWPAAEGPINRIQIERSDTGGGAGYANIGSATILAATRSYTFYDVGGDLADWYRWYVSNAANTFPSSTNRSYSTEQQPGPEEGGLLCSLYDVKQRIGGGALATALADEDILEHIRQVSTDILGHTGRQFVPDPLSGTKTYRIHTRAGYVLRVPKGIRSITTLGIAVDDQPTSGGTYTTATATDYYLDPPEFERDYGWPPTRIICRRNASSRFYDASYGAEITGAFGWVSVPADIQGIAANASVRRWQGRGSGTYAIATEEFASRLLRWTSPEEMEKLNWYRQLQAA